MRSLFAAAFCLASSAAVAAPHGLQVARRGNQLVATLQGLAPRRAAPAANVSGTWAASLRIQDEIHNFPVEIGQFPDRGGFIQSVLYREKFDDGTNLLTTGFVDVEGQTLFFLPRFGADTYLCFLAKSGDRFEADCEGDKPTHLVLKPMSAEHPFRFRPVMGNVNIPPQKDENTGNVLMNSYQSAVQQNSLATVEGTSEMIMDFLIYFHSAGAAGGFGAAGTVNLGRALDDPGFGLIPFFLSTLDGRYVSTNFLGATKVEALSRTPLVVHLENADRRLDYVVSDPED